jgi:AP-3 complex subunit beta
MNINERTLTTAPTMNTQGSGGTSNHSDDQIEPTSTLSIFSLDYKKHDDLKQMLDSNKDNLKLEAMRRIIGMIAKGKDAADLFPAVVKNVVSKNMEVKKLVYVYLMRYAEEQQDLALLSIATFQRGLKDPNQLIRASALRVLSSIRVPTIVSIMMLAIRDAVTDMSPYVRKTAANAIAKLYALDPELKEELVLIITKLLADKTILVNGNAVQAFEHVCPERIDLIHKNYRRLCNLLVDIDEWGQVTVLNMLTRYARSQFVDPNKTTDDEKQSFYENETEKIEEEDPSDKRTYIMDSDHRLLLRCTKPLLQSRNSAVVMAVAQLYYYVAPRTEIQIVAKSLIRLLRHHREIQTIVLKSIASIADKHKQIFEPYLKSFYVHSNDSGLVKHYKLEILTILANASNISIILREFQTYVLHPDKEFGAQTIHAIGRCASTISDVTEACLNGLVALMSKKDETIVAESVVVIKKLLQINPSQYSEIIKHIVRMVDKVTAPTARASILWLIGEYSDRISKLAPDVLKNG